MREMKDSNFDTLGKIPGNWGKMRLKNVCQITTGDSDTQDANEDGKYPFYVRSPIVEKSTKYTFDGEGILMAGDGAGAGRIFHHAYGKYAVHQRVYRLFDFKGVNSDYLFYYVSEMFPHEMDKGSAQSTVPSVRLPMLTNLPVLIPSEAEQLCIVNFLDDKCAAIDEAIFRQKETIEKLEEYKRATIIHKVSHTDTDTEYVSSGIPWMPEIPKSWDILPLKYAVTQRVNKNVGMQEKNLLTLSYGEIKRKNIETNEGLLPASFEGYNIIEKGDVVLRLLDLQNDTHSLRTGLVRERGIITSAYVTITPSSLFDSAYCRYLLHAYDLMKVLYTMGEGVRQSLSFNELSRKILIAVPPIDEQRKIAEDISTMETNVNEAINRMLKNIEKLEEYKKSLIYNAVTGKIDCRNA